MNVPQTVNNVTPQSQRPTEYSSRFSGNKTIISSTTTKVEATKTLELHKEFDVAADELHYDDI